MESRQSCLNILYRVQGWMDECGSERMDVRNEMSKFYRLMRRSCYIKLLKAEITIGLLYFLLDRFMSGEVRVKVRGSEGSGFSFKVGLRNIAAE